MSLLKFAGKGTDGTAKPVATNNNGNLETAKKWTFQSTTVFNDNVADTNSHLCDSVDVSNFAVNSIRVTNSTSKAITVRLLQDMTTTSNTYIADNDGNDYVLTIPSATKVYSITPDVWPILNYIHYMRLVVAATEAPSSGVVKVDVLSKR